MLPILANQASSGGMSPIVLIIYMAAIVGVFYFLMIRPQKKEQKAKELMRSELSVGDTVLTTSGFYGTVIDVDDEDDMVIVEFGSNKNCRIPMQRAAIQEIEKPEDSTVEKEDKKDKKDKKEKK